MSQEEKSKKNATEAFGDMMESFGNAVSGIFNDPKLKEKAKEFSKSARESAEAFAQRFEDEEVKSRFREFGKAAQDFGKSVADYFKEGQGKENTGSGKKDSSNSAATAEQSKPLPNNKSKQAAKKADDYFDGTRVGRITSSSFAIAWSIVLLIFFVYFNQYIAYYQLETIDNFSRWVRYPILTWGFYAWLPLLVATLGLSIIGHIILIIFDKYLLRQIILIILNVLGIVTIANLLSIFPFDFRIIPNVTLAAVLPWVVVIVLIAVIVGLGIDAIVRFVKLMIHTFAKGESSAK